MKKNIEELGADFSRGTNGADSEFSRSGVQKLISPIKHKHTYDPNSYKRNTDDEEEPDVMKLTKVYSDTFDEFPKEGKNEK